jgi:hypothetical protein
MITLLVDSNALRHPALDAYLASSRNHAVAFSDLTLMEMRKTNALATSRQSLRIVGKYPLQTFVLRRTDDVLGENIANAADAERLFDYSAGLELEALCRALRTVPAPPELAADMADAEADARAFMARLTEEVRVLEPGMIDAAKDFTTAELNAIRDREGVTDATSRKLLDLLKLTTGEFILANQEPGRRTPIMVRDLLGTFAFRYSLCVILYYMEWVRVGRTTGKKVERRVNDVVDMQIAAMGSYFSGVLSADIGLQTISQTARAALRQFGAYVGPEWTPARRPDTAVSRGETTGQ